MDKGEKFVQNYLKRGIKENNFLIKKKGDKGCNEDGSIRKANTKRLEEGWDEGGVYRTSEFRTAVSNGRILQTATMRSEKQKALTGKLNIVVCNRCDTPREAPKNFSIEKGTHKNRIKCGGSCQANLKKDDWNLSFFGKSFPHREYPLTNASVATGAMVE